MKGEFRDEGIQGRVKFSREGIKGRENSGARLVKG